MRFVVLGPHGNSQPFTPCAFCQFCDVLLAAEKSAFALLGVQEKALEVAEAVIEQARDLARKSHSFVAFGGLVMRRFLFPISCRGGENPGWIASKRFHAISDLFHVAAKDQVPVAVLRNRLADPAQHREVSLLR